MKLWLVVNSHLCLSVFAQFAYFCSFHLVSNVSIFYLILCTLVVLTPHTACYTTHSVPKVLVVLNGTLAVNAFETETEDKQDTSLAHTQNRLANFMSTSFTHYTVVQGQNGCGKCSVRFWLSICLNRLLAVSWALSFCCRFLNVVFLGVSLHENSFFVSSFCLHAKGPLIIRPCWFWN